MALLRFPSPARPAAAPAALLLAAVLSAPPAAHAADGLPVVVFDRDLTPRPALWTGVRDGRLTLLDASQSTRPIDADNLLALVEAAWWNPDPPPPASAAAPLAEGAGLTGGSDRTPRGTLHLTDGTCLIGLLAARGAESPDLFAWTHPALGRLLLPLERLARIDFGPADAAETPASADTSPPAADAVDLLNGDKVTGFVERVGPQIVVRSGTGEAASTTAPDAALVRRLRMANPPVPARGLFIWLAGGNALAATGLLAGGPDSVKLVYESAAGVSGQINVRLDQYRAIAPRAQRLVALATLPCTYTPGPDRLARGTPAAHATPADLLRAADIHLPGPGAAVWALPPGARRLAAWITLPASAREWADCTVRISQTTPDGATLLREARLDADHPWIALNEPLRPDPETRLSIEVVSGPRGPIHNRPVIRRALIAVGD